MRGNALMPLDKLRVFGNPNIGVYIFTNNKVALIPKGVTPQVREKVANTLSVEVIEAQIAGTPLLGVFVAGNDNAVLLPNIARDEEVEELRELGLRVVVIDTKYTALGNVILSNSKAAILYEGFSNEEVKAIVNALGISKYVKKRFGDIVTVGSAAVVTDKGAVVHPDLSDEDIRFISEFFDVVADVGTVNFGVAFIKTGLVANNYGALVGERTTGPEIMRITKALGVG